MSRVSKSVLVATIGALLWAAPTLAATQPQAVADCNTHGQLTQQYTVQELQHALAHMSPTVQEYTNCYDVIQRQLENQLGNVHPSGGGSKSGSGGSFLPAPVIIVLVVLLVVAGGYTALAVRRRGGGGPEAS